MQHKFIEVTPLESGEPELIAVEDIIRVYCNYNNKGYTAIRVQEFYTGIADTKQVYIFKVTESYIDISERLNAL